MPFATVLILDDNPTDALLLRYAFETAKIPVEFICVSTSEAALAYLSEAHSPDLIVLDFLLGTDTGLDVLNALPPILRARTVLLSGLISPQVDAIRAAGLPCFQKPGDFEGWLMLTNRLSSFVTRLAPAA